MLSLPVAEDHQIPLIHEVHADDQHLLNTIDGEWFEILHAFPWADYRQDIFRAEDDYHFCLEKLNAAVEKHQCDINAYVLMTNHVHLLVTPYIENSIGNTRSH